MKRFILLIGIVGVLKSGYPQAFIPLEIPVEEEAGSLATPFAGGLNQPQFSPIDLNLDGIQDLLVFDRAGNSILTFLNDGVPGQVSYRYAPQYESAFPVLKDWVLARDYDCDGRADLFTSTPGLNSITVYRNISSSSGLAFERKGSSLRDRVTNWVIPVLDQDLPAITDVDGDGDLDILTFDSGGFYVVWYQSISQDSFGVCDSLHFTVASNCWGEFMENGLSNSVTLGVSCKTGATSAPTHEFLTQGAGHAGSTLCTFDIDGDGILELLLGDLSHDNIVYLHNGGTSKAAQMDTSEYYFPVQAPAIVEIFPSSFSLDVNNDQQEDLLVTPNGLNISANYQHVLHYQDKDTSMSVDFEYEGNAFLVGDMVDCGESSYPVFFDYNADGLMDLVVGSYRYKSGSTLERSTLTLYRNIGTAALPAYRLETRDYLGLSTLFNPQEFGLAPAFGDMDGDQDLDMVVGTFNGELHYFRNEAGPGDSARFQLFSVKMGDIDVGQNATPQIVDVNRDGKPDLLVGENNGNLNYFENKGTAAQFDFTPLPDNPAFGGVEMPGRFSAYSAPRLRENAQGEYELYVGGEVGTLYHYSNIDGNLSGTFTLEDTVFGGGNWGARTFVDLADIDQDGMAEFVVGNKRGGIALYDTAIAPTGLETLVSGSGPYGFHMYIDEQAKDLLLVFEGKVWHKAEIGVFDLSGREIRKEFLPGYESAFHLALPGLSKGMYLLRVVLDDRYSYARKFFLKF